MSTEAEFVTIDAGNIDQHGFFCYKSKPKTAGYQQKRTWLDQRFAEGMKLHLVYEGKRSLGFIEYIPGAYAWRAVYAPNYMVIHCLWVVGQGKGQGYGRRLLDRCLQDAQDAGLDGVAMVTSSGNWLAGDALLRKQGFVEVASAPPTFALLVKRFHDTAPLPAFPQNWAERVQRYSTGLTVLHSAQCPYLDNAVQLVQEVGQMQQIAVQAIHLQSAQAVRELSPSPYGVFAIIYNGKLLTYHYATKNDLVQLMGDTQ